MLAILLLVASLSVTDARVIDGDTLSVPAAIVKTPSRLSVRLMGINAPETKTAKCPAEKTAGLAAKAFVQQKVSAAKIITVSFIRWDKYGGRFDGRVLLDGVDLSQMMLDAKLAAPYSGGKRVNLWCSTGGR